MPTQERVAFRKAKIDFGTLMEDVCTPSCFSMGLIQSIRNF
jgi:hypothetical protein